MATVFEDGPFRFFFWSRDLEDAKYRHKSPHVHIENGDGSIKLDLTTFTVERGRGAMKDKDVQESLVIATRRYQEILDKWHEGMSKVK